MFPAEATVVEDNGMEDDVWCERGSRSSRRVVGKKENSEDAWRGGPQNKL